jgi:SAM-dependent methyltransferase
MKLTADELARIAALTVGHYNGRAEAFWQGTRDHDVSQNIAALLQHIEASVPFTILDLGCGPGRDLIAFAGLGHVAVGVEGASNLAAMARANSGCEVWQQDLLALDLPQGCFDGVFANAVLFHVPGQELPRVLRQLHGRVLHVARADHLDIVGHYTLASGRTGDWLPSGAGFTPEAFEAAWDAVAAEIARHRRPGRPPGKSASR